MSTPQLPAQYYQFPGAIWRIVPDYKNDLLVVESRDTEEMQTFYAVLQPGQSSFITEPFSLPGAPWHWHLVAYSEGVLYLQGIETAQHVGVPFGVVAVSCKSKEILFQHSHLQWQGLDEDGLLLKDRNNQAHLYHKTTGELLAESNLAQHVQEVERQERTELAPQKLLVPQVHRQGEAYFGPLATFIRQNRRHEPVQEIFYLESETFFILGYSVLAGEDNYQEFLVTYTVSGSLVAESKLCGGAGGVGESGFFVLRGKLFLLESASVLVSLDLR